MKISIVGLNKTDVLLALYNNALCGGEVYKDQPYMKIMTGIAPPGTLEDAIKLMDVSSKSEKFYFGSIDLGGGIRALEVDLGGIDFDPKNYDNCHGKERAKKVIESLRDQILNVTKNFEKESIDQLLYFLSLKSKEEEKKNGEPSSPVVEERKENKNKLA